MADSEAPQDKELQNFISKMYQFGIVQVCKDGVVFTLLLTRDPEKDPKTASLCKGSLPMIVMEMALEFTKHKKPIIEVMRNDEDFLLLILKEATAKTYEVYTRSLIEQLQSKVHKITGDGEVMGLFNELLGISAG